MENRPLFQVLAVGRRDLRLHASGVRATSHHDHDYDLIADKTDLSFDSVWLADRGAL